MDFAHVFLPRQVALRYFQLFASERLGTLQKAVASGDAVNTIIPVNKMPQYCCVPACTNSGGHRFPFKRPDIVLKWRIAIKRTDPKTKGLWNPSQFDVVCKQHFDSSDYLPSLLGQICYRYTSLYLKLYIEGIFLRNMLSELSVWLSNLGKTTLDNRGVMKS